MHFSQVGPILYHLVTEALEYIRRNDVKQSTTDEPRKSFFRNQQHALAN